MNRRKILITSALPYANGPLHFGHIAGAYLPADCYARFQRLKGSDVLYICGSDEYGIAITLSAEQEKRTPKEHVDIYHAINKEFFEKLHISFDHYSRTTWEGHKTVSQNFFLGLLKRGYIEPKVTEQLFSKRENRFLADRYVEGECPQCGYDKARGDECPKCAASYEATDLKSPRSKITGDNLILKPTKHWFLRFDLFKEKLQLWISKKKWKSNVVRFAERYIEELKPRAITRDGEWGIPVPLEEAKGKVLYVWFDAPIGYISATMEWAQKQNNPELWRKYWEDPETKLVQFIGKDNIPFHAVFFPAMIMGQENPYKLVDELPANEFYNLEGRQFSKSDGWYIDLATFFHKFLADQIRYTIASNAPETQDAEFTWKDFQSKCNADLLGKFGNFANRVLTFIQNFANASVPAIQSLNTQDQAFLDKIEKLTKAAAEAYEGFHLRKASQIFMELCQEGNTYFDFKKPWKLIKEEDKEPLNTCLALCFKALRALCFIAYPIIPGATSKLWNMLGYTSSLKEQNWDDTLSIPIPSQQKIGKIEILFPKVEDADIQQEIEKLASLKSKKKDTMPSSKETINIETFQKLDLRVGYIESAEQVEKSKKLLKLTVDIGSEKRTIVAGIAESYTNLQDLIGRQVLVLCNIEKATLMGIESQGMLLVAKGAEGKLELPLFFHSTKGSSVS